jgi:hypothetical protein
MENNPRKKSQKELKKGLGLVHYDVDTIEYSQCPIGKSIYDNAIENRAYNKGTKYNDRILCPICNKEFSRSNRSSHNKTKQHKLMELMNEKIRKLVLKDITDI